MLLHRVEPTLRESGQLARLRRTPEGLLEPGMQLGVRSEGSDVAAG